MGERPCGDLELAKSVARNDEAAVRAFFTAYHPSVYRYLFSLCRNREEAEDQAQEAMLQAKSQIHRFRGESSLKTWVHKIAFHTFNRWARRRKLPTPAWPADAPSNEDELQDLIRALQVIGPALSHPFVLQEVCGFSVEEIAGVLSIPAGTVKSRLFTARKRLREILTCEETVDAKCR